MQLGSFWKNCVRVLKITRKPNKKEFFDLVKITGIGLIIIGFIGFLIQVGFRIVT